MLQHIELINDLIKLCLTLNTCRKIKACIHGHFSYLHRGPLVKFLVDCDLQIQTGDKFKESITKSYSGG